MALPLSLVCLVFRFVFCLGFGFAFRFDAADEDDSLLLLVRLLFAGLGLGLKQEESSDKPLFRERLSLGDTIGELIADEEANEEKGLGTSLFPLCSPPKHTPTHARAPLHCTIRR